MKYWIIALLTFGVSVMTTAAVLTVQSLNKDQINQLINGNTMIIGPSAYHGKKLEADTVEIYYGKDGKTSGKWMKRLSGIAQKDQGTWKVSDDGEVCVKWTSWQTDYCLYFYPLKDKYLLLTADQADALIFPKDQIVVGNVVK